MIGMKTLENKRKMPPNAMPLYLCGCMMVTLLSFLITSLCLRDDVSLQRRTLGHQRRLLAEHLKVM